MSLGPPGSEKKATAPPRADGNPYFDELRDGHTSSVSSGLLRVFTHIVAAKLPPHSSLTGSQIVQLAFALACEAKEDMRAMPTLNPEIFFNINSVQLENCFQRAMHEREPAIGAIAEQEIKSWNSGGNAGDEQSGGRAGSASGDGDSSHGGQGTINVAEVMLSGGLQAIILMVLNGILPLNILPAQAKEAVEAVWGGENPAHGNTTFGERLASAAAAMTRTIMHEQDAAPAPSSTTVYVSPTLSTSYVYDPVAVAFVAPIPVIIAMRMAPAEPYSFGEAPAPFSRLPAMSSAPSIMGPRELVSTPPSAGGSPARPPAVPPSPAPPNQSSSGAAAALPNQQRPSTLPQSPAAEQPATQGSQRRPTSVTITDPHTVDGHRVVRGADGYLYFEDGRKVPGQQHAMPPKEPAPKEPVSRAPGMTSGTPAEQTPSGKPAAVEQIIPSEPNPRAAPNPSGVAEAPSTASDALPAKKPASEVSAGTGTSTEHVAARPPTVSAEVSAPAAEKPAGDQTRADGREKERKNQAGVTTEPHGRGALHAHIGAHGHGVPAHVTPIVVEAAGQAPNLRATINTPGFASRTVTTTADKAGKMIAGGALAMGGSQIVTGLAEGDAKKVLMGVEHSALSIAAFQTGQTMYAGALGKGVQYSYSTIGSAAQAEKLGQMATSFGHKAIPIFGIGLMAGISYTTQKDLEQQGRTKAAQLERLAGFTEVASNTVGLYLATPLSVALGWTVGETSRLGINIYGRLVHRDHGNLSAIEQATFAMMDINYSREVYTTLKKNIAAHDRELDPDISDLKSVLAKKTSLEEQYNLMRYLNPNHPDKINNPAVFQEKRAQLAGVLSLSLPERDRYITALQQESMKADEAWLKIVKEKTISAPHVIAELAGNKDAKFLATFAVGSGSEFDRTRVEAYLAAKIAEKKLEKLQTVTTATIMAGLQDGAGDQKSETPTPAIESPSIIKQMAADRPSDSADAAVLNKVSINHIPLVTNAAVVTTVTPAPAQITEKVKPTRITGPATQHVTTQAERLASIRQRMASLREETDKNKPKTSEELRAAAQQRTAERQITETPTAQRVVQGPATASPEKLQVLANKTIAQDNTLSEEPGKEKGSAHQAVAEAKPATTNSPRMPQV